MVGTLLSTGIALVYLSPHETDAKKQDAVVRQVLEQVQNATPTINTLVNNILILVPAFTTKNFYVSPSGNDGNDGLTVGTPWKTILHATLTVLNNYIGPNATAQINIAAGTYTISVSDGSGAFLGTPSNWSQINYVGDPVTPSNVIIDGSLLTNGQAFYIGQNSAGVYVGVNGFQIQNFGGGKGRGFNCQTPTGTFVPKNIIFAGGIDLCFGIEGGFVEMGGPITYSGTNSQGVYANGSFVDFNGVNVTFSSAKFSYAFLSADRNAVINYLPGTVTGISSGAGVPYYISDGATIETTGGVVGTTGVGINFGGWFNNAGPSGMTFNQLPGQGGSATATPPSDGYRATITNATTSPTFGTTVTTGNGSAPVYYDGTTWRFG